VISLYIHAELNRILSRAQNSQLKNNNNNCNMAYQGPAYGLSRECQLKAEAKFDLELAKQALDWIQAVTGVDMLSKTRDNQVADHIDFADCLKDGVALCTLINALQPGSVKKVNTMSAPFKQRENLEQFLTACQNYGLKGHDLFQVSDLYERKNLYTVVNCLHALGGLAQKKGYSGPVIGAKVANENPRNFNQITLDLGKNVIGLQAGTNKVASQHGMSFGAMRQIKPDGR